MAGGRRLTVRPTVAWPDNLLLAGDALCNFNPFYSQGMTVCAMQANGLQSRLAEGVCDGRSLQACVYAETEGAWAAAKSEDLRFDPERVHSLHDEVREWYTGHFARAAARRPDLARLSLSISNFLASPREVFRPRVVSRVLFEAFLARVASVEASPA